MEEADLAAEPAGEGGGRCRSKPGVLREYERLVVVRHLPRAAPRAARASPEQPRERTPPVGEHHLGVVADLLQLTQHREDGAAAARSCARAPRFVAASGRPSPGRGSPARAWSRQYSFVTVIFGSSSSTSGLSFGRRRMNGRTIARSRSSARVSPIRLDRPRERALEALARTEETRVDDVHDRPELVEPVPYRRAGHRQPAPCYQSVGAPGPASVAGFFTSCASSSRSRSQPTAASASMSRVAMS